MNTVESYKRQHIENYKQAVLEIAKNNSKALVEGDILPLVKTPPLDSMDLLKTKLLSLAKKENVILDTEQLQNVLLNYRTSLEKSFLVLKQMRIQMLEDSITSFYPKNEKDVIKFQVKDLNNMNKKIKEHVKNTLSDEETELLNQLSSIFGSLSSEKIQEVIFEEFKKYLKNNYEKQLLENINIKILIKDRTLCSVTLEQAERYLFTKEKSHLFDE